MSVIIGADIVPVEKNKQLFIEADAEKLVGKSLFQLLVSANIRIFNLETPLADDVTPIKKNGRNLIASSACINGVKALGIDIVTLANNHIMDQGISGFKSTIDILNKAGIKYVGAGNRLVQAKEAYYFISKGKKFGIYACAEHEFSIATENKPGANPFDPMESLDHVHKMKSNCDYAIVLYHGGKEQYRYPSPHLQKVCRKLVEKGADLVICQHSHCVGCKEEYKKATIVYGQGNFLFSQWDNEYWNSGLIIELSDEMQITYHPVIRSGDGVRLATLSEKEDILNDFIKRSIKLQEPGFIEKHYSEYAINNCNEYILLFSGNRKNIPFRALNKLTRGKLQSIIINRYLKWAKYPLINYIECEAHRELILRNLKND